MLNALEFGPQMRKELKFDVSAIIGAVQDEGKSPHVEDAELERWRVMYEGMSSGTIGRWP